MDLSQMGRFFAVNCGEFSDGSGGISSGNALSPGGYALVVFIAILFVLVVLGTVMHLVSA